MFSGGIVREQLHEIGYWNQTNEEITTSAIRQKGESRNGCYKKTKHSKFSEKQTFLTPWCAFLDVSSWLAINNCHQLK